MLENSFRNGEDQRFADAVKQGNYDSLSLLYDKYAASLLGIISRIAGSDEMAEEILKITFLKIGNQIGTFDSSATSFFTYLINTARFTAFEEIKSRKLNQTIKTQTMNNLVYKGNESNMDYLSFAEPHEKTALDLIYYEGLSYQDAATELEITIDELKKNIRIEIKNLKEIKVV